MMNFGSELLVCWMRSYRLSRRLPTVSASAEATFPHKLGGRCRTDHEIAGDQTAAYRRFHFRRLFREDACTEFRNGQRIPAVQERNKPRDEVADDDRDGHEYPD